MNVLHFLYPSADTLWNILPCLPILLLLPMEEPITQQTDKNSECSMPQ
jgi:hypothetical protein